MANGHSSPRLPEGFHAQMVSMYSSAPKGASARPFACKHINIMDPLAASNNLGRSVSKASFLRLRKALKRGALTLGQATAQVGCPAGHSPQRPELGAGLRCCCACGLPAVRVEGAVVVGAGRQSCIKLVH